MKWMVALIAVSVVLGLWAVLADALEPGDTRVTSDTAVALCEEGHTGVQALDLWADGTCTVKLWALGASHAVTDTAFVYLRDSSPRLVQAYVLGWTTIDSMSIDLDGATETIYLPYR